jgi:hypothetical protein
MTEELTPLQRRLAERRAQRAQQQEEAQAPTVGLEDFQNDRPSEFEADELIRYVKGLPADLAIKFITEKQPKPHDFSRRDGIKFRCPHSDHTDHDPSAWLTPQKGLWHCGACETGGDWIELAAAVMGYRTSRGWNDRKGDWPKFRDELALLFNWKDPEPEPIEIKIEQTLTENTNSPTEIDPVSGVTERSVPTIPFDSKPSMGERLPVSTVNSGLDWRSIFSTDTFMHAYLTAVTVDDVPEEFHFASGLMALGMALGRTVTLQDNPPVYGNLYACVIGQSGSGKSKASIYLRQVLAGALPYDRSDPMNNGAKVIANPGSGEVLYEHFSRPIKDPSNDKKVAFFKEVRGLVLYPELAGLTGRAARTGATLKASLIELYDCPPDFEISNRTHGATHGEMPYGSLLTSTQPGAISELVSNKDDKAGFLNRFIFLTGTPKARFALNEIEMDLQAASDLLHMIHRWGEAVFGTGGRIQWEADARREWSEFFRNVIEPDQANAANDMLGRVDLLMKKLILLFAANKTEETVSPATVREACSLYQYFVESYGFTSRQISVSQRLQEEDDVLAALDRVLAKIAKKKNVTSLEVTDWPTVRLVQQAMTPQPTAKEVKSVLDSLADAGEVVRHDHKPKTGRPSVRYARVQS